ncbi:MAG: response regulator [Chlamydiota bacterium]
MENKPFILIVEDTKTHSDLVIKILTHFGYKTILKETGKDAIDFCEKELPNLVLLDISLPDMNGAEVAAIFKKKPSFSNIPIIAVSVHSKASIQETFVCKSFDDYISKPFTIQELMDKVRHYLG